MDCEYYVLCVFDEAIYNVKSLSYYIDMDWTGPDHADKWINSPDSLETRVDPTYFVWSSMTSVYDQQVRGLVEDLTKSGRPMQRNLVLVATLTYTTTTRGHTVKLSKQRTSLDV